MKDYITHLKFDDLSEDELLIEYQKAIEEKRKTITCTPNLDGLRLTYKNDDLRNNINSADFVTIDGKPIQWLAKLTKKKQFKYKISGSDLTPKLLNLANEKDYSVLIFGGKEGVAGKAKENIIRDYPNISKIETICPNFGFEKDENQSIQYINEINSYNCDIVLLCTGFPKTELFYFKYKEILNSSSYFCVGATVDFIAGNIKRAPKWMSKCGLEWLYRLSKDFRRLFKRYWLDFWFLIKILFICIFNKTKLEKMR